MNKMDLKSIMQSYLRPSQDLLNDMSKIKGDILLLGAGGKMGPAMAKLAIDAIKELGLNK